MWYFCYGVSSSVTRYRYFLLFFLLNGWRNNAYVHVCVYVVFSQCCMTLNRGAFWYPVSTSKISQSFLPLRKQNRLCNISMRVSTIDISHIIAFFFSWCWLFVTFNKLKSPGLNSNLVKRKRLSLTFLALLLFSHKVFLWKGFCTVHYYLRSDSKEHSRRKGWRRDM